MLEAAQLLLCASKRLSLELTCRWGFWGEPEENIVDAQSLVQQRLTDWEGWMVKDGWKARFS